MCCADIAGAIAAERERIAAMLSVEARVLDTMERASGRLRNCSAAGVFREAAMLVREGATAEGRAATSD